MEVIESEARSASWGKRGSRLWLRQLVSLAPSYCRNSYLMQELLLLVHTYVLVELHLLDASALLDGVKSRYLGL